MTVQKIRVRFAKGDTLRYIGHLDVLRAWERSIRRSGLPLAYSQGFTPHPKIAFASPLPLGFAADNEVLDVTLDERIDVEEFRARLAAHTVPDLPVLAAAEIPMATPSPQAALRLADYRVRLPGVTPEQAAEVVKHFVALESFPWTEERHEKTRVYDLRQSVVSLRAGADERGAVLTMRLRADQEFTGRPEQVVAALFPGTEGNDYTRANVILEEVSPARDAWQRRGQYE